MPLPLIVDTDVGTDVDDALALAFALRHPEIELRAVTTVSGDARRRASLAKKLLAIADREDVEVAAGLGGTAPGATREPWAGHEGDGVLEPGEELPVSARDAVTLLLEVSREGRHTVATIGMQSNVAAALDRDPSFAERVRLVVMGGAFAPIRAGERTLSPSIDHNLNCDPHAALRSLGAGIPTLYVPVDVTIGVPVSHEQVDRLRRADELSRTLAHLIDVHPELGKPGRDPLAHERAAVLHDPLAIACAVERRFVTVEEMPVTVALHDGRARTFVDPLEGRPAEVVTGVDAQAFSEFWLETVAR